MVGRSQVRMSAGPRGRTEGLVSGQGAARLPGGVRTRAVGRSDPSTPGVVRVATATAAPTTSPAAAPWATGACFQCPPPPPPRTHPPPTPSLFKRLGQIFLPGLWPIKNFLWRLRHHLSLTPLKTQHHRGAGPTSAPLKRSPAWCFRLSHLLTISFGSRFIGQGNYDSVKDILDDTAVPVFETDGVTLANQVADGTLIAGYVSEGAPPDSSRFMEISTGIISPRAALFKKDFDTCACPDNANTNAGAVANTGATCSGTGSSSRVVINMYNSGSGSGSCN